MPIFEYRCDDCSNVFEELVTGDRDQIVPCPTCSSNKTKKLMSALGGISLGGSSSMPSCGSGCSSAGSCSASGGHGCPHAG